MSVSHSIFARKQGANVGTNLDMQNEAGGRRFNNQTERVSSIL